MLSLKKQNLLKVLQICNKAPYPPDDGSSIAVYNMARGFIENGVDLHFLTINTKKHFKPDEKVPDWFRSQSRYQAIYHNTDTSLMGAFLNLFSRQSYFVSRFYFKAFEEAIVNILKKNTFDIVHLEGLFVGLYIDAIRKHSKAKIILRAHNVEYLIWERHLVNEKSVLKRNYLSLQTARLKKFEKEVLAKVDAIVSITEVDGKMLGAMNPGKAVYTCITGVNMKEYENTKGIKPKPSTIFCFSSMDWMPNQEAVDWFVNNCWEKVARAAPHCKLVIAGRNMPARFFKLKSERVEVIEKVENGSDFYHGHDIMLVPLLSGSGLRIKIIEGMSYGKAIVSTGVGAEGIRTRNGQNILIADTPEQFANAVILLLNDEGLKNRIEASAKEFAMKHFDNTNVVAGLTEFYKGLNV